MELTPTEQCVYDFIVKYNKEIGYLPTHVAIANHLEKEGFGKSRQNATKTIASLKDKKVLFKTTRFGLYQLTK